MSTNDTLPEPIDLESLRASILLDAPDPASDPADFAEVAELARRSIELGEPAWAGAQVRVRMSGPGIARHEVSVRAGTRILDLVQGALTAIGSSLVKRAQAQLPVDRKRGGRVGVKRATELKMSSQISAGSIVFVLRGRSEAPDPDALIDEPSEGLIDSASVTLLDLLARAENDSPDDLGHVTSDLQALGASVASKLSGLTEQMVNNDIYLDLGHRSPRGRRHNAVISRRGADVLREAIDRNRKRTDDDTFVGTLNTVSDGSDMLRMTLADGTQRRLSVDPELGVHLGTLLGRPIVAQVETTTTWHLTTGKEVRKHRMLDAHQEDAQPAGL